MFILRVHVHGWSNNLPRAETDEWGMWNSAIRAYREKYVLENTLQRFSISRKIEFHQKITRGAIKGEQSNLIVCDLHSRFR